MSVLAEITARSLVSGSDMKQLLDLVIAIEKEVKSMDFTEPLYQYLKEIVKKEDPSAL